MIPRMMRKNRSTSFQWSSKIRFKNGDLPRQAWDPTRTAGNIQKNREAGRSSHRPSTAWLMLHQTVSSPADNTSLFFNFSYVCPEPVLANIRFLKYKMALQKRRLHTGPLMVAGERHPA